jgi:hypothetical protein
MTRTQLMKEIEKIPGDNGWWHTDGGETYKEVAGQLLCDGFSEEKVLEILERLYGAAAGEFGS